MKHLVNAWYCDGLSARSAGSVMSTSGNWARGSRQSTSGSSFCVSSKTGGSVAACSAASWAVRTCGFWSMSEAKMTARAP